ncbi:hypothetical protein GUITHDRAFT_140429 [Guillardia theta CCMP2712]|uniref:Uncharacterized protein n=1 Tax=Guillardia theta (strain CCMP2712) TaxID=905079 RepID=L1J596_GUITC|nr:hypothetical protein GUITHDRAFT_140429 [Guillardia theta CCMP2712]EKX43686.1 hypothetical protein GUITHDRAFT_140429 [Guillardia theta CCMP2712]|eukprot:XP_005830666.1 hypothetical protein GUITHDRAFT_140429 [Guillardia theta CCMP2712]
MTSSDEEGPESAAGDEQEGQELTISHNIQSRCAPKAFAFTNRHRRCSSCGRPVAPNRSTAFSKGPARLWERVPCQEADTADGYASKSTRTRRALEEDYERCELCYDHRTDLAALMRHRSLPVVNGLNLLARYEAQDVTGTDVIAYPDGSQYIGDVKESKRHGRGIMLYANGSKYLGMWWEDKMHGIGEASFRLGGLYRGEWYMGQRQGHGSYIYSQTWVKKVCFSPAVVVVVVVMMMVKELLEEYVGGWMQDKPMVLGDDKNGWGIQTWKNGDVYIGCFRDGNQDGHGTWRAGKGRRIRGREIGLKGKEWENGKFLGVGEFDDAKILDKEDIKAEKKAEKEQQKASDGAMRLPPLSGKKPADPGGGGGAGLSEAELMKRDVAEEVQASLEKAAQERFRR